MPRAAPSRNRRSAPLGRGALLARDNVIEQVQTPAQLGALAADRVLGLAGPIVVSGMVNRTIT